MVIGDGSSSNSYCGTSIPSPITSTTGTISVQFISDSSTTGAGFDFDYSCGGATTPATTPIPTIPPYVCGGALTEYSGTITSRNYPEIYPNNEDCTWTKQCSGDIVLTFVAFQLESHSSCR